MTAGLLLAGPLAGCASDPAEAAAPASARASGRTASPEACSLVSAEDVSLYVALASWEQAAGEQDGRAVCRFSTAGYTVTTVTMPLRNPASPPPGLCRPPGSSSLPDGDLLCGYRGPGRDTVTAVGARAGLAVGVRVTGPDAGQRAALLARHALTHL